MDLSTSLRRLDRELEEELAAMPTEDARPDPKVTRDKMVKGLSGTLIRYERMKEEVTNQRKLAKEEYEAKLRELNSRYTACLADLDERLANADAIIAMCRAGVAADPVI